MHIFCYISFQRKVTEWLFIADGQIRNFEMQCLFCYCSDLKVAHGYYIKVIRLPLECYSNLREGKSCIALGEDERWRSGVGTFCCFMNEMPVHNIKGMGCDTLGKEYGSVWIHSLQHEQTILFFCIMLTVSLCEYLYVFVSSEAKVMLLWYCLLFCRFHSKVQKVM